MKLVAYCCSFLLVSLLFVSCQQEPAERLNDPDPPTDPNPPAANDSIYLKMLVTLDTSLSSGLDTVSKLQCQYDASKRAVLLDDYEYYPTGNFDHDIETRFYNGTDTLPYKASYRSSDNQGDFDVYFTYQNGVIVSDSVIQLGPGTFVYTYIRKFISYGNGKFGLNRYHRDTPGGNLIQHDSIVSVQVMQNGNIVSQHDTSFYGITYNVVATTREFDNHPNPCKRLYLPYPVITIAGLASTYSSFHELATVNNEVHFKDNVDNADFEDDLFVFQYRADGYPVISRELYDGSQYKNLYFYQTLP